MRSRARAWIAGGRALAVVGMALTVANCSNTRATRRGVDSKYGVKPSPKVVEDGQPIPKGGGRAMIGKPYVVGGQTYVPTGGRGYDREGYASWYGAAFHGRLTANGEVFDRESIAAAHPTLPLPSYVRVTNLTNRRSMIVRVNDRGPYERSRLVDVSERVAEALEFHRKGTTRVRLEYVGKASLNGSDDRKLLATLRVDGAPAPFGRAKGPVMVADLREEPPAAARIQVATAPEPPLRERPAAAEADDGEGGGAANAAGETMSGEAGETAPIRQTEDAAPPPRRPKEPGGPAGAPGLASPPPPILHLPPSRPVLAGIY